MAYDTFEALDDLGEEGLQATVRRVQKSDAEHEVKKAMQKYDISKEQAQNFLESLILDAEKGSAANIYRNIWNKVSNGMYNLGITDEYNPLESPSEIMSKFKLKQPEQAPSVLDYYDSSKSVTEKSAPVDASQDDAWWKESFDWLTHLFGK